MHRNVQAKEEADADAAKLLDVLDRVTHLRRLRSPTRLFIMTLDRHLRSGASYPSRTCRHGLLRLLNLRGARPRDSPYATCYICCVKECCTCTPDDVNIVRELRRMRMARGCKKTLCRGVEPRFRAATSMTGACTNRYTNRDL